FPLIREKCRRMLGDAGEADDVAQDTFIRLWQARLDGDRRISSWIYRTSTRLAIDRMRERARKRTAGEALENVSAPAADDVLSARRQLAALALAVPAEELEIAVLSRLDRLTQAEIGEVLDLSDRT